MTFLSENSAGRISHFWAEIELIWDRIWQQDLAGNILKFQKWRLWKFKFSGTSVKNVIFGRGNVKNIRLEQLKLYNLAGETLKMDDLAG